MKKILLICIFSLILTTSLIKNSTKEIEDKIFTTSENIRSLKMRFGDEMLEYNYLSSPQKIKEYQSQFFENELINIDITKIQKIILNEDNLEIINFVNKLKIDE